jgi:tetratricopeptide (TPR) repeat protein
MIPTNPYIAGDPVSGSERFIGRTDVLRDVLRVLRNPNSNALVLYGQRRIGKTSILLQLQQQLAAKSEHIPVYFDLQDKAALPLADVLYQLAQRIAEVVGLQAPTRKEFGRAGQFFRETFLPQAAAKAGEPSLVLLFDEFDVLDMPKRGQAGESFFPYLRGWMSEAAGVQFIFVMGRRPDDLSTDTLAAFKQVGRRHVSLMSREDSLDVIRQSEKTGSLTWHDKADERVWYWTQGHPYLTQLLCSEIWETAYDDEPETPPKVSAEAVDGAVPDALERGAHAFLWIWDGLPSAERIVMAAMAEVDRPVISRDELANILNRSGVRLILRELDLAPETLVQWDLLRPVDGGYRFAVPLLKQWVVENKPLQRVKQELDSIEPLAQNLFQAAQGFYNQGELDATQDMLTRVLNINPNHMQARLLLGRVYLGQDDPETAVKELEPVYKYDPSLAQQDLIGALLALAQNQTDVEAQLTIYERVLSIDPQQAAARQEKETIWRKRAEAALSQQDFDAAQVAYQQIGDQAGLEQVKLSRRKVVLAEQLEVAAKYEEAEAWGFAISIYEQMLAKYPDETNWQQKLKNARDQAQRLETYNNAILLLQKGEKERAQRLLADVINQEPAYKEAPRYLLLATTGIDIVNYVTENIESNYQESSEKNVAIQPNHSISFAEDNEVGPTQNLPSYIWLWSRLTKPYFINLIEAISIRSTRQAGWLVGTLIWILLATGVIWLLVDESSVLPVVISYLLLGIIGLVWLLTGIVGHQENKLVLLITRLVTSIIAGIVTSIIGSIVVVNLTVNLSSSLVNSLQESLTGNPWGDIVSVILFIVASIVVFYIVGFVAFMMLMAVLSPIATTSSLSKGFVVNSMIIGIVTGITVSIFLSVPFVAAVGVAISMGSVTTGIVVGILAFIIAFMGPLKSVL